MTSTLILGRLLEQRLFLLHNAKPFVLLNCDVLKMNFRVCMQPVEKVHLSVATTHIINPWRNLLVVLLFTSFQNGSGKLGEIWRWLFLIKVHDLIESLSINFVGEEVIITIDQELNLILVVTSTIFIYWKLIIGCLGWLMALMHINVKGQFNWWNVEKMIFQSENSLIKVEFLFTNATSEHFSKFLIAIDQISVIRVLEAVRFDILPKCTNYLESSHFFNSSQNSRKLGRDSVSFWIVIESHDNIYHDRLIAKLLLVFLGEYSCYF